MDLGKQALNLHRKYHGKLEITSTMPLKDKKDLSLAYTPGVAAVSSLIANNKKQIWDYTIKSHTVAVVSDGSAVLGLGNIGPEGALPVMEGKCALFKEFAGVDAFPICLNTQDPKEIISIVKNIAPVFGGINLEDIAAPNCFIVEDSLQDLGIPVMHDDQHGSSVVVLAGLINAAKVVGKKMENLTVVISGAGAAGQAVVKFLLPKVKEVLVLDSKGIIYQRRNELDIYKKGLAKVTNQKKIKGDLKKALEGADVFIGVSKGGLLKAEDIQLMGEKPIVFAMANPVPEIMPTEALKGGACVVATGRSDYPNQINNVLAFPGIFKGALKAKIPKFTDKMFVKAAEALASLVKNPTPEKIIPDPFDKRVVKVVSEAVRQS